MNKKESLENKKIRAHKILQLLKKKYSNAKCGLIHKDIFELLVLVPLSAQTTDEAVNKVAKQLFQRINFDSEGDTVPCRLQSLVNISQIELENILRPLGFFHQKAKNLHATAKMILEKYDGKIPNTMSDLIKLPGIARKSANIILEVGFGIVEGIAVDTHVKRISNLLKLSIEKNPDKIEQELMKIFSKSNWGKINHLFIAHGRETCIANRPKCDQCPVFAYCPNRRGHPWAG